MVVIDAIVDPKSLTEESRASDVFVGQRNDLHFVGDCCGRQMA
jgi:hypothetical protein